MARVRWNAVAVPRIAASSIRSTRSRGHRSVVAELLFACALCASIGALSLSSGGGVIAGGRVRRRRLVGRRVVGRIVRVGRAVASPHGHG